ncbi:helix-turn-helix domain-containing protein [Glaciecola sp.]|jgi:transcriptional regulator with XRE-family HTH domain|uniref:helix-turn-helix domain-containing protein n=1 Tax=Glaciecola sp. MF2-115 TaxID=3384827 RepID=UPI003989CC27
MKNLSARIGQKIRQARRLKGLSQEKLALNAKIDRSYMGRIERGEANITVDILYQLATILECEPQSLLP